MTQIKLYISFLVFCACFTVHGQDNTFYRKFNLPGMHGGLQLEATSDGGFVATGQHEGNGSAGGCDVYVYRVDPCGNNLWYKMYGTGGSDGGKSIKQTSDGGFIVAAHYNNGQGALLKLDGEGDVEWTKTYSNTSWVMYAEETANGDYICIGHNSNLSVFRTDSQGNVLWSRSIGNVGNMSFYITELPNGDFLFPSTNGLAGKDVAVTRLSSNGNLVYSHQIGGTGWGAGDHTEWSCKGILDPSKEYMYVTSPTAVGGSENIMIFKMRVADASIVWAKSLGGANSDQSREITLCPGGIAIVGNTDSYPIAAGANSTITENMSERDILLTKLDTAGSILWSRSYGGDGRDRGIGVKYNFNDNSFNISSFSSSTFFQASFFDPVFIKTDSLGNVNCQMNSPNLTTWDITPAYAQGASTSDAYPISASNTNPSVNIYVPNDVYVCQNCSTEPVFNPSDTIVCVNEPVYFINTTTIGLTCFQEWLIDGQQFNGGVDTLIYSFSQAGDYEVELYSNCGGQNNTFVTTIHVYDVAINSPILSDYNGVNISCNGFSDGSIQSSALGGYLPGGAAYTWSINPGAFNTSDAANLAAGDYSIIATDLAGCADTFDLALTEPAPLSSTAYATSNYNQFEISCYGFNDGSAAVDVEGGTAPYSVQWLTAPAQFGFNADALYAGAVEILIIDENNCQISDTTLLEEPTALVGTLDVLSDYNGYEVSCYQGNDGIVSLTASGGVEPYAITFNNLQVQNGEILDGLSEQQLNYSFTDANGCVIQGAGSLNDPPQLTSVISIISDYNGSEISCPGLADGQAQIVMAGGVSPYLYLWSDGATNAASNADLPAGTATVEVLDLNGCPLNNQIDLAEPPALNLSANVISDFNGYSVSCFGGTNGAANASASGGTAPLYYWWSNGTIGAVAQGLDEGNITAFVTDVNQCDTLNIPLNITEPEPLEIDTFSYSDYNGYQISCFGANDGSISITPAGGVAPYVYSWNNGSGNQAIVNNLAEGIHNVTITDDNGCILQNSYALLAPQELQAILESFADTCYRFQGHAMVMASGGVVPYAYNWNGLPGNIHQYGLQGGANTMELTDLNNCTRSFNFNVGNLDAPVADMLIIPETDCSYSDVLFQDISLNNPILWQWTIEGIGTSDKQSDRFFFPEIGEYTVHLWVENAFNCADDTTQVFSLVNQDLRIFAPNTFTPNGDEINDYFKPVLSGHVNYTFTVYNRWGEVVYRGNELSQGWAGDMNGNGVICQNDLYYYTILAKGVCDEKLLKGYVQLCE